MTDNSIARTASVLVAVDISKARHEVLIAVPDKKRRRRFGDEAGVISGSGEDEGSPHNIWDKNDPKDAQVILHIMAIGNEQFYRDHLLRGTNGIQELSKTHDIMSKSKITVAPRADALLAVVYPGSGPVSLSSHNDWFFAFLERYPSPHFTSAMSKDAFISDAW